MYKLKIKRASASKQPVYMLKLLAEIQWHIKPLYNKDELEYAIRQVDDIISSFCDSSHKNPITGKCIYRKIYGTNMDIYTQTGETWLATIYFEEA
jgi:hypothetical protein